MWISFLVAVLGLPSCVPPQSFPARVITSRSSRASRCPSARTGHTWAAYAKAATAADGTVVVNRSRSAGCRRAAMFNRSSTDP